MAGHCHFPVPAETPENDSSASEGTLFIYLHGQSK